VRWCDQQQQQQRLQASKTLIKACTCFKAASRRNTHLDEPSVLAGIGQAGNSKIRLAASLRRAGLFL